MNTNPSAMPEKTRTEDLPLISVIVPVYKVERYLDRCIQSIVDQTYRNLEIILVDDGSPDACPDMCDAWAARDCRIRVIHQENRGQANARNNGIESSRGILIGFVDSDDWLEPTMYEVLQRALEEHDADISMTGSIMEYSDGHQVYLCQPNVHLIMSTSESFKYVNLPGYQTIAPWSKLIRRSVLGNIRFPESQRVGEDYQFTYDVLAASKRTTYDSTPLYHYRQIEGSVSNTPSEVTPSSYKAIRNMVELVRQKFPEQLPFALYGQMRSMVSLYDQALVTGHAKERQWRDFARDTRAFIRQNIKAITESVTLPHGRRLQLKLMAVSTTLYGVFFLLYKRIHPERSK